MDPVLGRLVRPSDGHEARGVEIEVIDGADRVGSLQHRDQVAICGFDVAHDDGGVGVLDQGCMDLGHTAVVGRRRLQPALAQQVVAQEVRSDGRTVHHGDHGGHVQRPGEGLVVVEHAAHLGRIGRHRQVGDDRGPLTVVGQPHQGRHDVFTQGTADARMVEVEMDPFDDAGHVADSPCQNLSLDVDLVAHGDGIRHVPLQGDHGTGQCLGVDAGQQHQGSAHASIP
ncbi:hypothetical protein [Aeromicrobium sp. CF3.5]|uniref:hypothetical protein n=1 Tax=Aeromicrobium sp. CF3.5 TaxID=3373078 RepID=UPI003EE67B31